MPMQPQSNTKQIIFTFTLITLLPAKALPVTLPLFLNYNLSELFLSPDKLFDETTICVFELRPLNRHN